MPHLSKLAKEYEGKVTFLGLSDEDIDTVKDFLADESNVMEGKTWGEAMAYAVATDPDKSVKESIFSAAGQRGIPASFIISEGKVQWIGHPMSIDATLEKVVSGDWDITQAKKEHADRIAVQKLMGDLRKKMAEAQASGNWDEVLSALDKGIEKYPTNDSLQMQKFNVLLLFAQRSEEAYTLGNEVVEKVWGNAQVLNQIAWTVVDDARVKQRDLGFAQRVAERANELTKSKDGAIMDTLARVHYEAGRLEKAVEWQRKAVKNATGTMADQLREVLEKYEAELKGGVR